MSETAPKVVIRHVGEDHEDAAHGGAWKVAYADFMTAMMAFFLLMWILSTTEEQKLEGLADYFTPSFAPATGIGGAGALAGTAPEERGILANRVKDQASGPNDPVGAPNGTAANPWADIAIDQPRGAQAPTEVPVAQPLYSPGIDSAPSFAERQNGTPWDGDGSMAALQNLAETLTDAVANDPQLAELGDSFQVELTDAGLELRILDSEDVPMFDRGATGFTADVAALVAQVGASVAAMPNQIVITGHTDAVPYPGGGYTNWELSTDRAHATRRALIAAGIASDRFARVSGVADREPLFPDDPFDPSNRRISIHLLAE